MQKTRSAEEIREIRRNMKRIAMEGFMNRKANSHREATGVKNHSETVTAPSNPSSAPKIPASPAVAHGLTGIAAGSEEWHSLLSSLALSLPRDVVLLHNLSSTAIHRLCPEGTQLFLESSTFVPSTTKATWIPLAAFDGVNAISNVIVRKGKLVAPAEHSSSGKTGVVLSHGTIPWFNERELVHSYVRAVFPARSPGSMTAQDCNVISSASVAPSKSHSEPIMPWMPRTESTAGNALHFVEDFTLPSPAGGGGGGGGGYDCIVLKNSVPEMLDSMKDDALLKRSTSLYQREYVLPIESVTVTHVVQFGIAPIPKSTTTAATIMNIKTSSSTSSPPSSAASASSAISQLLMANPNNPAALSCALCGDVSAVVWCKDEDACLCKPCDAATHRHHGKAAAARGEPASATAAATTTPPGVATAAGKHNRVPIGQSPIGKYGGCDEHGYTPRSLWCHDCCRALCPQCKLIGSHSGARVSGLDESASSRSPHASFADHRIELVDTAYKAILEDRAARDPQALQSARSEISVGLQALHRRMVEVTAQHEAAVSHAVTTLTAALRSLRDERERKSQLLKSRAIQLREVDAMLSQVSGLLKSVETKEKEGDAFVLWWGSHSDRVNRSIEHSSSLLLLSGGDGGADSSTNPSELCLSAVESTLELSVGGVNMMKAPADLAPSLAGLDNAAAVAALPGASKGAIAGKPAAK